MTAFAELHEREGIFLLPNAYDAGSAKILASLGFEAVATTSSGFAATLGRPDYSVGRDEKLEHARALARAVDIPVSADFENGFADAPEAVAENVRLAARTGLAGLSVEDATGRDDEPIYARELAIERVRAAADASGDLVLTARCESLLHGVDDLREVIGRLQAYQEAGADVLFAPGLRRIEDVRTVVAEVDRPVNVLALPGLSGVEELEAAGVRRVSVGGWFAWAALSGLVHAAEQLKQGSFAFMESAVDGAKARGAAF